MQAELLVFTHINTNKFRSCTAKYLNILQILARKPIAISCC